MARLAQQYTTSYSNVGIGSSNSAVFNQVNLQPNSDLGVTSYDNAELTESLAAVYHYAQQTTSYLRPLIPNAMTIKAQFVRKNSFNKMNLVPKLEEAGLTPLATSSGGTRAYSAGIWNQGYLIDRDVENQTEYSLTSNAQMELANAVGRTYDAAIIHALVGEVLEYSSTASKTFTGQKSASIKQLPSAQKWIHATAASSTITYKEISTDLFDDIVLEFEKDSISPEKLIVIGTPLLRRKLKNITDFRNMERSIVHKGPENSRLIPWLDLNFLFLGPEVGIPKSLVDDLYVDADGGEPVASSVTGAVQIDAAADDFFNFIVADLSVLIWGDYTLANEMRLSERDDLSYAKQFYMKVGFGGMRMDDLKVRVITAKA